ncbi:MAG: alpha/beta fold hydrolase [Verrucomicrobiota bacterium]|nr:alpha/beta fold hydrolase [Verrucomicrobiota bacterium]
MQLDRTANKAWQGTIDIPVQGLRGFKLDAVKVDGPNVSFEMPGIPGEPRFSGRLAADGKNIAGSLTQAGQTFPVKLERTTKPATVAGETPSHGVPGKGLAGYWQGSLKPTPAIEMRLVLEITNNSAGKPEGAMVSVDQGNARIQIETITEKDGSIHLEMARIGGAFDGKTSPDGSEIAGDWKQGGLSLPIVFKRLAAAPKLNRPQEPQKPYPYFEEEVVVENNAANVKLAGTLTLPRGPGPHPAAVLITGSGAQDRDEAIMGHRPFLVLADHLTRRGIAVLRCDDRGFGKSSGDFAKATNLDFVEDALAAVRYLRTRREIDAKRIGLIGHSEGSIVAARAAAQSRDVAFVVMLAGVGVPMEEVLLRQARDISIAMGASEETVAENAELQRSLFRLLRENRDPGELEAVAKKILEEKVALLTEAQKKALSVSEAMLEGQIKLILSPWFRELLDYDPRATLRNVKCPVLALNGAKDLQVAADVNLPAIREALAASGNQSVKTVKLPGLNHLFQTCQTGTVTEYGQIEETFNTMALNVISDWIRETVSAITR